MFDLAAASQAVLNHMIKTLDVGNKIISHLPFDLARRDRAPTEGREPEMIYQFLWRE